MVRQEWKKLFHNKILLLVVIAVIAIPSIYTTLFLGSMWDPYGKADKLPVAVVNQDQAAYYEGKEMKIGEELTEKLKEDDSLDFRFTDEKNGETVAGRREMLHGDYDPGRFFGKCGHCYK